MPNAWHCCFFYAGSGFAGFAIILNRNNYYSVKNFLKKPLDWAVAGNYNIGMNQARVNRKARYSNLKSPHDYEILDTGEARAW